VVLFPQFASQPPSNQAKEELMSLRTVMQAGPAKANELFAKLLDTSNSAVKTREKLFTELKAELELHVSLEEQHLFPVLRRNIETKGLVADAIKDNKDLRAKLAELEALPKNEESFPERLKELQSEVDPVWWSPPHFRRRLLTWPKPARLTRLNFVDKWLNWFAPVAIPMTLRESSNQPRSRSATGSAWPIEGTDAERRRRKLSHRTNAMN
jgi:hypothetical protein